MDKQPVGQLPDLTQSNNDDEIMVITNDEYNQLKKEKISDFITDLTSTNENNALTKGTDGKMFVTDFGNASNITEGTLPVSVLPDIPKDLLPAIETSDLPVSGVTAGKYIYPTNLQVNNKGQILSVENGVTTDITKEQIDTVAARQLSSSAYTQADYPDEYGYWQAQAHNTFDLSKFKVVGSPTISEDGILSASSLNYVYFTGVDLHNASVWKIKGSFIATQIDNTIKVIFSAANNINGFGVQFYVNSQNYYVFQGSVNSTSWLWTNQINSSNFQNNTKYYYVIEFTGTKYNLNISTDDIEYTTISSYTTSDKLSALTSTMTYNIGSSKDADRAWNKPIDLKDYAVWADGVPVFNGNKTGIDTINGTLEIPYTETTDGTKIVDAAYFDRVQDCYEQTGEALYLTLDEQNQQYYLPMGTITGFTSKNRDKIDELNQNLTVDILQAMPIGASIAYEGTTPPDGWFAESGTEVQQSAYPKLYAVVGDKYNLETTQEGYFRLPDTNVSSRFYEGSTTPGTLTDAGLPNITGQFQNNGHMRNGGQCSGAFYQINNSGMPSNEASANDGGTYGFQASRSSNVYGKSTTVQPKSITKLFIIKHD